MEVGDEDHTSEHQLHSPLTGGEHPCAASGQPQKLASQPPSAASLGIVVQGRLIGVAYPPHVVAT